MKAESVIFDYGGVLTLPPHAHHTERITDLLGVSAQELHRRSAEHRHLYDRGTIDGAEYWRRMAGVELPLPDDLVQRLIAVDVESWSYPNEETLEIVRELKSAAVPLGLLSNMHWDCLRWIRGQFQWLSLFETQIYSCEVETIKPEPAIYRLALEQLRAGAERTLFIDDSERNVAAAREVGMHGHHFQSAQELRAALALG